MPGRHLDAEHAHSNLTCPHCGGTVVPGELLCPHCNQSVPEADHPQEVTDPAVLQFRQRMDRTNRLWQRLWAIPAAVCLVAGLVSWQSAAVSRKPDDWAMVFLLLAGGLLLGYLAVPEWHPPEAVLRVACGVLGVGFLIAGLVWYTHWSSYYSLRHNPGWIAIPLLLRAIAGPRTAAIIAESTRVSEEEGGLPRFWS